MRPEAWIDRCLELGLTVDAEAWACEPRLDWEHTESLYNVKLGAGSYRRNGTGYGGGTDYPCGYGYWGGGGCGEGYGNSGGCGIGNSAGGGHSIELSKEFRR